MSVISLSKQDTCAIKGIAICAMLIHHLYCYPGFPMRHDIVPYTGLLKWLGELGKVCVSLFLFCSGYGLSKQYKSISSIKQSILFVFKRFVKFYTNYWTVFVLFIPIGVFVFLIPFSPHDGNLLNQVILDFLGLLGYDSYNITWWFNQVIILFYLFFPILYALIHKFTLLVLLTGILLMRFGGHLTGNYNDMFVWQFPFILGIFWEAYESKMLVLRISEFFNNHQLLFVFISVLILVICVLFRMNSIIPHWSGIRLDAFLSCAIVLIVVSALRYLPSIFGGLGFLGKHSVNVYLIHSFFNGYWNPIWLHTHNSMRYGLNFIVLISLCVLISLLLEWLKSRLGVYRLSRSIVSLLS